jgi:hypothetical protein
MAAADIIPGKYACIIEQAALIETRTDGAIVGRMKINHPQFIMSVESISEGARNWLCGNRSGLEKTKGRIACSSSMSVAINSRAIRSMTYFGDSSAFYGAIDDAILTIIGLNREEKPEFLIYETAPLENEWGQYVYRGQCDRF